MLNFANKLAIFEDFIIVDYFFKHDFDILV